MSPLVSNRKLHTGQEKLADLFRVPKSALKRAITGHVRNGGKQYEQEREREKERLQKKAEAKDKKKQEKIKEMATAKLQDKASDVQIGFACHICTTEFDSCKELNEHLNNHQRKTTYFTCPHCSEKYTNYNAYLIHQESHKKKEFICCECRLDCGTYKALAAHAKPHKFPCSMCLQVLGLRYKLKNHMKFLHGRPLTIFNCSICKFAAADLTQYHAHFNRAHHKFKCKYCRNSFSLQAMLDKHVTKEHPSRQECDPVDPVQPSTSTGMSSQLVQTSQAGTVTDVNPLNTAEGGTVQPLGMKLRQCPVCGLYFGS